MSTTITGGCHCGAVRYETTGELSFPMTCYCDGCRRISAGARLAGAGTADATLTVTGDVTTYTYDGEKAPIRMHFCPKCGTGVYSHALAFPGFAILRIGTLDDASLITEVKPIFTEQRCSWDHMS